MRLYHGTGLLVLELIQRHGLRPYTEIGRRVLAALDQPTVMQPYVHLTDDPIIASIYAGGLSLGLGDGDLEHALATGAGLPARREGVVLAVDVDDHELADEFAPGQFFEDQPGEWVTDRVPADRLSVVAHIAIGELGADAIAARRPPRRLNRETRRHLAKLAGKAA